MSLNGFVYRDYNNCGCSKSLPPQCMPVPPCCCTGPTGPAGPTGPTGQAGVILGSYETLAELIRNHPTGSAGDMYIAGGVLYIWDAASNSWKALGNFSGPTGPTGAAGATGATGPTGPAGTITGTVDSVEELPNPGNPGDMYLVDGVLYVWDEEAGEWVSMGSLIGPTGPTGPAGVITGSVDSVADLPNPGNPGDMYLVDGVLYVWDEEAGEWVSMGSLIGPTGPAGVITGSVDTVAELPNPGNPGDMYLVDGVLYVWNEEAGEWILMGDLSGPTGPTGPTGPVGTITGSVDTVDDLPDPGNPGDMYLVDGILYVWDEETGEWNPVGDLRGPAAQSYTIIPFAAQIAPRTHISGGLPSQVSLLGFGYGDERLQGSDADDYAFPISISDYSFNLEAYGNFQLVFSLPFDMTLRSVALTTGNYALFDPPGELYPYVQIYYAAPTSNTFLPIEGAIAEPEAPIGPGTVPANVMRSALTQNLEINLEAGTRIAIGALARMSTTTTATYYLYYTGGIGFTPWIR